MPEPAKRDEEAADCAHVGRYANYFKVGHNAFEVVLEFGERFSDANGAQLHTRIVTNPIYAQALLATLHDSLRQYEELFGASGTARPPSRTSPGASE